MKLDSVGPDPRLPVPELVPDALYRKRLINLRSLNLLRFGCCFRRDELDQLFDPIFPLFNAVMGEIGEEGDDDDDNDRRKELPPFA